MCIIDTLQRHDMKHKLGKPKWCGNQWYISAGSSHVGFWAWADPGVFPGIPRNTQLFWCYLKYICIHTCIYKCIMQHSLVLSLIVAHSSQKKRPFSFVSQPDTLTGPPWGPSPMMPLRPRHSDALAPWEWVPWGCARESAIPCLLLLLLLCTSVVVCNWFAALLLLVYKFTLQLLLVCKMNKQIDWFEDFVG
jgi:hypothetical protein